ncbi:hypothetical protein GYMLUDRAFT_72973 [Collybiopsis luxurians FD-317 M1]|uniref:Uncharacterized protein n=1 Tax=Collybiopsis luxurians FD-317 M1 TaxID=944289 RepID=A0A0D0C1B5_9AGAR|nr:hypothetical protein GYMLUDRAFT_72973 [Collybiopsis luxurians FD-317 M1]
MSESSELTPSPPISINTEQEVVHLPPQAISAPDTADLTLPPEYSSYSESRAAVNEPPTTVVLGSDQPTRTQFYDTTSDTNSLPPEYSDLPASTEPVPPPPPPQIAVPPIVSVSPALLLVSGENQRHQPIASQTENTASSPADPHLSFASVNLVPQVSSPPPAGPAATTSPAGPLPFPAIVVPQTSIATSMAGSRPNSMTPMNRPPSWVDVNVSHSPTPVSGNASSEGMTVAQRLFASADITSGGPTIQFSQDIHTPRTRSTSANIDCTPENSFYSMGVSENLQQQQQQYNLPRRGRPPANHTGNHASSTFSLVTTNQTRGFHPQNQAVGHFSSNSVPVTSANTIVQPGPKVLPNFKLVARPPSPEAGSSLTSSMGQLSISSSLPGINSKATMQGQPGVSWIHSPLSPAPTSGGGWGHVNSSAPMNTSLSNPSQHLQAQAPIHYNVNPFPSIPSSQGMQQQQNAHFQVPVASLPNVSNVYPTQGVPGNLASALQSPSQPPQLFQYPAPTGYTPSSVPVSPASQPLQYPATSFPGLPSSQLPQSPPHNMLPMTASHTNHSLSSSLSPELKKYGEIAGRVATETAVRYGTKLVINSLFGLPPPSLFDQSSGSGQ